MLLPVITCLCCVSLIQEWCQYTRSTRITAVGEEDAMFTSRSQLPARPIALSRRIRESCVLPGHLTTALMILQLLSNITCTLIEWKFFRLTYSSSCSAGAWIRMWVSIYLSLSIYLSIHLSIHLSIYLFIYLSIHPSIYLYIYL